MLVRFVLFCLSIVLIHISCKENNVKPLLNSSTVNKLVSETNHPSFVSDIKIAHQKSRLLNNGIVCFNLDLTFGSNNSKKKIFTTPTSSAIRIDKINGASTVMIDGDIFTDADSTKWASEKFGIYTYQYFFMAPYKFSDKGTVWNKLDDMVIDGENTKRAKLTFESGIGDAPDDWYIIHSDPNTNRVKYIGYIVTGGGTPIEEAEKNAHVVKYSDYQLIDGVPIAFKWEFYDYNKEKGLGDKIGEGIINNVEMMDVVDQFDIINDGTYTKISG
jgi:hypothetical protein